MNKKRWIGRFLWLSAWAVWLWLGFGLYRELPRNLGQLYCELPHDGREFVAGFLPGGDEVLCIVHTNGNNPKASKARIRDARYGEVVKEFPFPKESEPHPTNYFISFRHQFLLIESWHGRFGNEYFSIDLRTGAVSQQFAVQQGWSGSHPTKPLMLTYMSTSRSQLRLETDRKPSTSITGNREDERVEVVDIQRGLSVFSWKRRPVNKDVRQHCMPPFFTADGTMIAISTVAPEIETPKKSDIRLEFYSLGDSSKPVSILPGVVAVGAWATSTNGLVVCNPVGDQSTAHVFEIASGRLIATFSAPEVAPGRPSAAWAQPELSPDGRTLLQPTEQTLWSLASTRPIWRGSASQTTSDDPSGGVFPVSEDWSILPTIMFGSDRLFACRRLSDASLVYRCVQTVPLAPEKTNSAGHLVIDEQSLVRDYPPQVDWFMLAVCQTFLAMPVVLFWLVLFIRRRRKPRLAAER